MSTGDLVLIFIVLALVAWRLSALAGRLDRVHIRRDQALTSLRLQLAWRTSAVAKLLTAGILDPVSANVLSAEVERVTKSAEGSLSQYIAAESDMTQALCKVFDDKEIIQEISTDTFAADVMNTLADACRRVELARRFHNDAVGAAQLLHKRKLVRYLRLAGRTDFPVTIDMDDSVPTGFEDL